MGVAIRAVLVALLLLSARAGAAGTGSVSIAWGTPSRATDWRPATLPGVWQRPAGDAQPLTLHLTFDARERNGLALFSDRIRERYRVYLNGSEVFRSNADAADRSFAWHRPLLLPLPPALLRPTGNVLQFRIAADVGGRVAVGTLAIGPERLLRETYRRNLFWSVTGPETVTGVMLVFSAGALLFWIVRPRERVFGWLAIVGLLWATFNLQYFLEGVPFDDSLFWTLHADTIFLVFAGGFGFAATFLNVARQRELIAGAIAVCAVGVAVRHGAIAFGWPAPIGYFIMWPLGALTCVLLARACMRDATIENVAMLAATTVSFAFGVHDLLITAAGWRGIGVQIQSYGGLLMFLAFGFALGRRVLVALATVEDVNLLLEQRVEDATHRLQRSERERQQLEVTRAVDSERERLMREIHDGIGSSLIRALAVARRERQSPNTIETLKRSIADLRIGIDSLEPFGGDVAMLLANLRHRTERDLNDAGLTFVWKAMAAPPIPWLDAVGALHILRIMQEAIGNVLKHANATEIAVDCSAHIRAGKNGVLVSLVDNGCGFRNAEPAGHGLGNMAGRAAALNATFTCESVVGMGTTLRLWLPLDVPEAQVAAPDRA